VLAENRRGQDVGTRPAAAAVVGPAGDLTRSVVATETTVASPAITGGYLAGPTTAAAPTVIEVAVKPVKSERQQRGHVAFRRWAPGSTWVANPCATPLVKVGTTVTITNLDNGHATKCVNVSQAQPPSGLIAVLDTAVFEQIGELVQAPVPVSLTW